MTGILLKKARSPAPHNRMRAGWRKEKQMPWKRDENGSLVMDGENPVWIGADGKEGGYDPEARGRQIAELTAKAAKRKEELEAITARFASLEGVEDVAAFARQAKLDAETVASLKDKDRENEDVVRRRIDEAVRAATGPVIAERDKLKADYEKTAAQLSMEVIGGNFLRSPYVNEKLVNPAMAKELFAGRFALRDGALVAKTRTAATCTAKTGISPPSMKPSSAWLWTARSGTIC